jgi:hypothetical protein
MKTIFKFVLATGWQVIEMPAGAKLLSVQAQNNQTCLWAEVDTTMPMRSRSFIQVGTGRPLPGQLTLDYIGTVQLDGGELVLHVYEDVKR